ncbi:hypothetical protein GCM10010172_85600 [Paractinoplanes ferrugineus]|uniref:Uncharacterized protein n=1 Tax=Paractinoplanes ferrugineus TaxID=113564 RepID=A0A919MK13_9ACTN|nr:hypothetical protein [Actinoplanes ferrugineus]GIE15300.1 hypothetical protein Afe05nite_71400 [Actinoplanes ferrugineus]
MPTYFAAPPEALLHRLLLRAAGSMPDESLVRARVALAAGDPAGAAAVLAQTPPVLDMDDRRLLGTYLPDARPAGSPADPAPEHTFTPADPRSEWAAQMPPVLDLTTAPEPLRAAAADAVDDAATAAAAGLRGAVGLWRAWRSDGPRVYVLELDAPVTELAAATAEVMRALTDAGAAVALVETYATGTGTPAYQQRAKLSAALLWARDALVGVELVRVFDSVDAETGPAFDADHEQLHGPERRRLLRYLDSGAGVLETTELMVDVVEPERGAVVPMSYRTDGDYVWTDTVGYYLREYGLAPDPDLVRQARRNAYVVPEVGPIAVHRALAELFRPVEPEPVWTA